jgi:arylsulfatase A-like enzyme
MRQVKLILRESLTLALWVALVLASWQTALAADSMPSQSANPVKWIHFSLYSLGGFFLFTAVGMIVAVIIAFIAVLFRKKFTNLSARKFLLAVLIGTGIFVLVPLLVPGPVRPLITAGTSTIKQVTGFTAFLFISLLMGTVVSYGFFGLMTQLSARAQWSILWGLWLFLIIVSPLSALIGNYFANGYLVFGILGIILISIVTLLLVTFLVPKFYDWMQKGGPRRWTLGAVALVLLFIITNPLPKKMIRGLPADENSPPVILVTIDTLRADGLGCYGAEEPFLGTPNIDRVADEGALFEHAYSAAPWTLPGVASFLTGLTPAAHGAVDYELFDVAPGATSVAEIFGQDYVTAGFVVNPLLAPGHGIDQGFDYYTEEASILNFGRRLLFERLVCRIIWTWPDPSVPNYVPAMERVALRQARNFVREHDGERYFLWLHLCSPHAIYFPPREYRGEIIDRFGVAFSRRDIIRQPMLNKGTAAITQESLRTLRALYAGEVTFSDDLVGKLISDLESLGVYDDCVFAISADHGEEFYEHDRTTHAYALYPEQVQVPLIIRHPSTISPGLRIPNNVSTIDLPPTLLDLAGVQASLAGSPAEFMGRSLVPVMDGEPFPDLPVFLEGVLQFDQNFKGFIFGDYLYMGGDNAVMHSRLYNLAEDPEAYYNVLRDHPDLAGDFAQLLREQTELEESIASRIGAGIVSDNREKFRAVGYLN